MPIQIIATGSYLPELVASNNDLAAFLDTNDEWIRTRSGISTRHIATDETTSEMGAKAASVAMHRSGLRPEDIDLVICATLTPDTSVPMTAANIKKALGIERAAAFDLNGNCSGFIYAITAADSLMKNCGYDHAIVVGSDTNSQMLDWTDRSTCVLFGDGAGAVVLSRTDKRGIITTYLDCKIDSDNVLIWPNRLDATPFCDAQRTEHTKLAMQGSKVMRFVVKALIESVRQVTTAANVSIDDVKYIVPHQANLRMIESAAETMRLDMDKFYINIDRVANTSHGTIPIALDEMAENKLLERGDLILLTAFGGGLSSGAVLLEW
ncbi:ketoacyl-ACP synthase III [bacterium]|nr:ketoacyl-ACP synthase III [bacterium]